MEVTPSSGTKPDRMSTWVQDERKDERRARFPGQAQGEIRAPGRRCRRRSQAFIGTSYMREKMVMTLDQGGRGLRPQALRRGAAPRAHRRRRRPGRGPGARIDRARGLPRGALEHGEDPLARTFHHYRRRRNICRSSWTVTGRNFRFRALAKTFEELEASEPTAEVLARRAHRHGGVAGRPTPVRRGDRTADQGRATKHLRNPSYRHVRLWYALGDVYDRAGDLTSARELFARVVIAEPDATTPKSASVELGTLAPRKNRKRRVTPGVKKKSAD